ncbi:translocation/assembly module TamB domain-containing protein [Rheinheimera salexigens]|uniref:autotransporter assembly complex protein TamB n=1 Tax=Rheinheimera salexigens TaxID=1628148 RepID=UPI0039F09D28
MNWRRGLKWLNFTLFIPFLVIVLLMYMLLFTQLGLNFTVWLAEKFVPELTVKTSSGHLLGQLQLQDVQWQQDEHNSIVLKQLDIDVQVSCLLSGKVCINQILVDGITVNINSAETTTDEPSTSQAIFLPLPVAITTLAITDANIKLNGHQLTWQQLSASIDAWGSKLQLDDVLWQQVNFTPAPEDTSAVTVAIKSQQNSPAEPFSYQTLQLDDINLPLAVYISQFTLTDFTLHTATPQYISQLQFAMQAQKQQINVTQLHVQHPQLTVDANIKLNMTNNYPVSGQIDILVLDKLLAQQKLMINIDGDLADLNINAIATNNIQAQLAANLALLTDNLPIRASFTANEANTFTLDDNTTLSVKATKLELNGDLQQLLLSAKTNYHLTGIPAGSIDLIGSVTPINAKIDKLLIRGLGGKTQISAIVDWQQELQWQSDIQFNQINLGILLQDYPGRINGLLSQQGKLASDGSWLVNMSKLDINGEIRELPFTLRGDLQAQANNNADADKISQVANTHTNTNTNNLVNLELLNNISFNTKKLSLIHGDNSINFNGGLAEHWQLNADINIPDLSKSVADANGNVSGKITVSGARLTPNIAAGLQAADLHYQQFSLDMLQLDSQIQLAEQVSANINLVAKQGRYQHNTLEQLTINVQGNEQKHKANIELQSNIAQADITFSGQLNSDTNWLGQLNQARLSSAQGEWKLQQATAIQYDLAQQQATIAQHCWAQQQTMLCLEQQAIVSAAQGQLALTLDDFALSTLNSLLPAAIETDGEIHAKATASWQPNIAPKVAVTVQGANGNAKLNDAEVINLPWQSFNLQLDSAEQLTADFAIDFTDKASIKAQAVISELMQAERKLAAQLNITAFSLDFLQPLLDSSSDVTAEVNSELQFSGLLAAPDLTGKLSVDNIKIMGKRAPTSIENGSISLAFLGETAAITGNLNTPDGKILLTGDANWQDITDWHATMKLAGDALSLQVPNVSLKVKPDLTVDITPQLTLITGVVEVPSANISIDDLPQSAVGISSDTILLDEQGLPTQETDAAPIPIHTDIKVILTKGVQLQAFGLVTKLSGELSVKQQDKGPQIYGEVALVDGTFRSYGQDLLIRRGKLKFNGPVDQPYLDIEAIRNPESTEDGVIAGIKVVGPADEPIVTIFSEPSKPQANALSYLIAGRDIGSDSGSTSDALTTSLIGMSIASSSKLVGNIGAAFGINDLSLDTAGAGTNSQVTVSGHLSRDLELKYGYGIFNAVGEFTLRYRIMRRLYLESVSGLDNTVDLLYKFEFD